MAYGEAQGALRARLAAQAASRQQAEAIRASVLAADGSPAAEARDYAGWRDWVLVEADALDPPLDGSAPFDRLPTHGTLRRLALGLGSDCGRRERARFWREAGTLMLPCSRPVREMRIRCDPG